MNVESNRNLGATPQPPSKGPSAGGGPSLFILLAEDNPVNQKLTIRMLEKRGHRVELAENGRIAVDMYASKTFDLVLMDVMMPEMDGLEATIAIRERERGTDRHIPIVALTANAMKGDRERCLESGMDKYLSKPIRPADLYAAVESFVPAEAAPAAPEATEANSAQGGGDDAAVDIDVFDRATMLERLGDDEELLVEILDLFVSDAPEQLSSLEQAMETGEAELVTRHAHTLKGQAANIAAARMQQVSLEVELAGKEGNLALASELVPKVRCVFEELLAVLNGSSR